MARRIQTGIILYTDVTGWGFNKGNSHYQVNGWDHNTNEFFSYGIFI